MGEKDIPDGMRLKQAARWNQLEQDWALFLKAGPDGCFVAEVNGKVIGTVTIINYVNRFSWIGMVLIDPETRRMGIGTALLKEAIRVATGKGTIRLDATPDGKKLYDTLGFKDEYNLSRYQLALCERDNQPAPALTCYKISPDDINRITSYDGEIFGAPRPVILQSLFRMGKTYAWILKTGGQIKGYCLGRPGSNFEQVGPIIAVDKETACSLLLHALDQCHGKSVVVDVPDDHKAFRLFVESIGFTIQRPYIRMYLGRHDYPGKPEFQYAIAGPEIG
jgi:GNAT superfamily N-acetyltransferase